MKRVLTYGYALAFASVATITMANEAHHVDKAPPSTPSVQSQAPSDSAVSDQLHNLEAAKEQARLAKTPTERQQAMQEQMQTMTDAMAMMKSMHAGMDCPTKGKAKSSKPSSMDDRMKMMDMMMQMMHQQTSMMSMPMGPMGGDAKE